MTTVRGGRSSRRRHGTTAIRPAGRRRSGRAGARPATRSRARSARGLPVRRGVSRADVFEAIASPDRDVAPAYRAIVFQMKDGRVFTGVIAFESADGYIVQTGATATVRLANEEIEAQWPGSGSLMPSGLLDGLRP